MKTIGIGVDIINNKVLKWNEQNGVVDYIMPSGNTGYAPNLGEGILGASVGSGYLHTIPSKCCQTIGMSQDQSLKGMHSPFGNNAVANNDPVIQPEVPVKQMIENIESKISPTTSPGNE